MQEVESHAVGRRSGFVEEAGEGRTGGEELSCHRVGFLAIAVQNSDFRCIVLLQISFVQSVDI